MNWHSRLLIKLIVLSIITMGVLVCPQAFGQRMTLHNEAYDVVYIYQTVCPEIVTWVCHPESIGNLNRKKSGSFKVDKRVPKPRATTKAYVNSGYHRGHLCPAADFTANMSLYKTTYLLSNVCPMVPELNMGRWKVSENITRQLANVWGGVKVKVYIFTDSVGRRRLPRSSVTIPSRYCKQVYTMGDSLLIEWSYDNN